MYQPKQPILLNVGGAKEFGYVDVGKIFGLFRRGEDS